MKLKEISVKLLKIISHTFRKTSKARRLDSLYHAILIISMASKMAEANKGPLRCFVNRFILLSNLHVIVSEFYDLDVGTVKRVEIKPKRLPSASPFRAGWNLKEVT